MKTKPGLGMWAFVLVALVVVIEQAAAQGGVTAGVFLKPFLRVNNNMLKSLDEAKEACMAYGLVIATEDQVKALPGQNNGSYVRNECAWMANGKTGSLADGTTVTECTMQATGANVWCIAGPDYTCPMGWTWLPGSMSCFKYTPKANAAAFAEAKSNCSDLGGYLATIDSKEEQTALENMAVDGPAFIGLNGDPAVWNDGSMRPAKLPSNVTYTSTPASAKCAGVDKNSTDKWIKMVCATKNPYICEMDLGKAPNFTVSFESSYVTTGGALSGNCMMNIIPVVLRNDLSKKYAAEKNLLCTAMTGVDVSGPYVSILTVKVIFPNTTEAILTQRIRVTFMIRSDNYAKTLDCSRYLKANIPAPMPNIDAGGGCAVLKLHTNQYTTLDAGVSCNTHSAYDMKRSCLPYEKACTAFSAKVESKGLATNQFFTAYGPDQPNPNDTYVMTEERCAAICKNHKPFICLSYSYELAPNAKPVTGVCKISPQRASMYNASEQVTAANTSYYERACPMFVEAPVSRRVSIKQTFKPTTQPECARSNGGADLFIAAALVQESFIADTITALKDALVSGCGFITGMISVQVTGFGNVLAKPNVTDGSVEIDDSFTFVPATPLISDALISSCINTIVNNTNLTSATNYSLGPLCQNVTAMPITPNPVLAVLALDDTRDCTYTNKRPFPSSVYFLNAISQPPMCLNQSPLGYKYEKGQCSKLGPTTGIANVNLPACTAQCEAKGENCTAFAWNSTNQQCDILKDGCEIKLDSTMAGSYYTKESKACLNSQGFTDVSTYVKEVVALYIGQPGASNKRNDLCSDAKYVAIQKEFTSNTSTLMTSCGTLQIMSLMTANQVATAYRNMTCMNGVGWPEIKEPSTCKVRECKDSVMSYLTGDVIPGIVKGGGALFNAAMKHQFVKSECLDMMKTCSNMTQYYGVEGLSLIFTVFQYVYPQIEQFPGPMDECQERFFTDEVVKFVNFHASSTKGVQIVAADLCTMFANLKGSLYLVAKCQPSVKLSSQMLIGAYSQLMTGVCEKSTVDCLKSTYMQCFINRTEELTIAFASGKGTKSKICFNNTKENFNKDLQGCLTNSQGCTSESVKAVSKLYPSLVDEFFSLCDKNENMKLNTYFAMSLQFEIEESKECLFAKSVVCLKSLNKNLIEGLTAGSSAASQTCAAYETAKTCVTTMYKKCSPVTRLNLLEALMKKRVEIIKAVQVCSFTETATCTTGYQNISTAFNIATKAINAGTYDCKKLTALKTSVTSFISASGCYELMNLYVKAGFDTIEYFLRDRCSACATTDALKNYINYQNAFLDGVMNLSDYATSGICTGRMSLVVYQSTLGDISENCDNGGARLTAISKMTSMYQEQFCKKRDYTWLIPETETCKIDVVQACFASYKKVYLVKLAAGNEQSVKEVCTLYHQLSACVIAALKTCNGQTQTRFLTGLAYLRSMLVVMCELKPEEKECNLVKAYECLSEFRTNFMMFRNLVVGGKSPKALAVCGSAKITKTCIEKNTLKCGDKETSMVMFYKRSFELFSFAIKKECDVLIPKQCDLSESFNCLVSYAENVTETLTMVDRRNAFLCTTNVKEKVTECAASSTLDCGERSKSFIETVTGLEKSTKQVCNELVCRQDGAKANILFLLDASGSVNAKDNKNFYKCKMFVKNLVKKLEIGEYQIRVAASTYASAVVNVFGFNRYYEKKEVLEAVGNIIYTEGGTYTHLALDNAATAITNIQKQRGDIPSIVIVMTDGKSITPKKTLKAAEALKKKATVYSIGIGDSLRPEEVKAMASNDTNLYTLENFDKLDDIVSSLSQSITCEGLKKTPGDEDPTTCKLTEAKQCLLSFEKELFDGFAKDGENVLKVTCLNYTKTMECLKLALLTCTGPTQFRMVEAFYLQIKSSMEICKEFLPKPKDTCKVKEAMECFSELQMTIAKVNGAYEKVCVEINEKQNCVYDRIAACTDFETYLWVSRINAEVYRVKKSKKCEGKILPPKATGKECDDSEATKCMFEFEEQAMQAAYSNYFGRACLKLVELKECILGRSPECTPEQTAARIIRFKIKYALVSPKCLSTAESDECKFKEIQEKMEDFAEDMLEHLMVKMTADKKPICKDLQEIMTYTVVNMKKCSLEVGSRIDKMAQMLINQLKVTCPNIVYGPVVRSACDIISVKKTLQGFNATVFRNMATKNLKYCAEQPRAKILIENGLKNCPADDVTEVNTAWKMVVDKIGMSCTKRFDVNPGSITRITLVEGETRLLKYKFIGCKSTICQGQNNCQVKIFYTLTNLRGNAKCKSDGNYLVQGAFSGTNCGFELTDQNCGDEFNLVLRSRVFYVDQETQIRDVIFYYQMTINGVVVTYKMLDTKIQVTFEHKKELECKVWGDPHIIPHAKNRKSRRVYNIFKAGFFTLLKYKASTKITGRNIEAIFQPCTARAVSCMCALYIQCGGGVIKFGECRRTVAKKGPKCTKKSRKGFSKPNCDKKPKNRPFMEVDRMYNGNIDQCTVIKIDDYQYVVYQPHGRRIDVRMTLPKTMRVVKTVIYALPKDNTETEGVCRATKTTWKQFSISNWNSFLGSENLAKYNLPPTPPMCLCTATGEVKTNLKINEDCDGPLLNKDCNYNKQSRTDITKAFWSSARRVDDTPNRRKRAVAANPFAIDPNAVPKNITWGDPGRKFTEKTATDACNKAYDDYMSGALRICLAHTKQDFTNTLDQCVIDVKMTDTDAFCEPSAGELWKSCNSIRSADTTYMNSPSGQALAAKLATLSCPNSCSGSSNGKCVAGVCECVIKWKGQACDVSMSDPPSIISVGINGGVCDPAFANCTIVMIGAANVYANPLLTCHYMEQKYNESARTDVGTTGTRRGTLVAGNVKCELPKAAPYLVALSNDGVTTSSAYNYLVYSPKCETCNITTGTCKPVPKPMCRVNGVCYLEGEKLKGNDCFYCNLKESTTKLSLNKSNSKCGGTPTKMEGLDTTDIIIIAVISACVVVGLAVFLIYKFIAKPKMDAKEKEKQLEKERTETGRTGQEPPQPQQPRYAQPPQGSQQKYMEEMPAGTSG
ncbi:uncharacterized protein LOC135489476 isoform X2 [Lineus longissimus]|uniref:uncharacterized protein LOC135489476 isoform X2 n=1 Tax=Lineus longissimus TaxID=88925 RepID=UPI002B4C5896